MLNRVARIAIQKHKENDSSNIADGNELPWLRRCRSIDTRRELIENEILYGDAGRASKKIDNFVTM